MSIETGILVFLFVVILQALERAGIERRRLDRERAAVRDVSTPQT